MCERCIEHVQKIQSHINAIDQHRGEFAELMRKIHVAMGAPGEVIPDDSLATTVMVANYVTAFITEELRAVIPEKTALQLVQIQECAIQDAAAYRVFRQMTAN